MNRVTPDELLQYRGRYCVHRAVVDNDPHAISWPRGFVCLHCGEVLPSPGRRPRDGDSALYRLPAAQEGSAAR